MSTRSVTPAPPRSPFSRSDRSTPLATPAAALLAVVFTWLMTWPLAGQTARMSLDDGMIVRELGAVCAMTDEGLVVQLAMPAEARPEAFRSIDIRRGDVIMAWNGQRIRDLATARGLYDDAEPGSAVALGIDRDGQKRIVRFSKSDPADLPERMVFGGEGGGHGMVMQTIEVGGDAVLVAGFGVLVEAVDDAVQVAVVLPMAETELREQDVVVEVAGATVVSPEHLAELVDAADVGSALDVVVHRAGETLTLRQIKADAQADIVIDTETAVDGGGR